MVGDRQELYELASSRPASLLSVTVRDSYDVMVTRISFSSKSKAIIVRLRPFGVDKEQPKRDGG